MNTIINNESILRKNPVILHQNQDSSFSKTELDPSKIYLKNADGTFTELDPSEFYLMNADSTFTQIDTSKMYSYNNGEIKALV